MAAKISPDVARALNESTKANMGAAHDAARRAHVFAGEVEHCPADERAAMLAACGRWARKAEAEARTAEAAAAPWSRKVTIDCRTSSGRETTSQIQRPFWTNALKAREYATTAVRALGAAPRSARKAGLTE